MFQVGNITMGLLLMMKMLMCVAVTALSNQHFKSAVRLSVFIMQYSLVFLVSCCSSVSVSSTDSNFLTSWYSTLIGAYSTYADQPILNGATVYEKDGYCLHLSSYGTWSVGTCDRLGQNYL